MILYKPSYAVVPLNGPCNQTIAFCIAQQDFDYPILKKLDRLEIELNSLIIFEIKGAHK